MYFFRNGSVIADVDLIFAENATDVTPETLRSELPDSGEMGNLTYDPQSALVKGAYFGGVCWWWWGGGDCTRKGRKRSVGIRKND